MKMCAYHPLLVAQFALVLASFLLIALVPPPTGRMLLVPLGPAPVPLAAGAVAAGAAILGRGPLPGSLVVQGDRAALVGPALSSHAILVRAGSGGCTPSRAGGA